MPAPIAWRADGTPVSPLYGDVYRSPGTDGRGGLAQARQVFLRGCGLLPEGDQPALWCHAAHWAVLETGFGLGLNFLATWQAWLSDAQRPARLIYSAIEAHPASADDILRSAAPFDALHPLAQELAAQWHGLLPGLHRIALSGERVQLLLSIGPVPHAFTALSGAHHSLFLDGFNPRLNPDMWSAATLQAASALCRPDARAATWCVAADVRQRLGECGFAVERVPGLPPKRHALRARRTLGPIATPAPVQPGRCAIVGGGLAGGAAAWSLAQRGWQVHVFDAAPHPANGASALPAGVLAPHVSPDDAPLSRLSRAGLRATAQRAALLLRAGHDFALNGVLEHHAQGRRRRPASWSSDEPSGAQAPSLGAEHPLTQTQRQALGLPPDAPVLWHRHAGWLRPAALVQAALRAAPIQWHGNSRITRIRAQASTAQNPAHWQLDTDAAPPFQADLIVLCAGFDTLDLLDEKTLPLDAVRGQMAHGPMPEPASVLPAFPVNGQGSLIAHLPDTSSASQRRWVTGSSFVRGRNDTRISPQEHQLNLQRLHALLPDAAAALQAQWQQNLAQAWAGVRAALPDHLPAVGAWPTAAAQAAGLLPLQLLTGLGARGLSLSVLCGELLAAQLHHEPLPLEPAQAQRLAAQRWQRKRRPA